MSDDELERWLALYRACCAQSGVEPLPDDEARDLARRFFDLLAPALRARIQIALIQWRPFVGGVDPELPLACPYS